MARKALIQTVLDIADASETLNFVRKSEFDKYENARLKGLADPKQRKAASKLPVYGGGTDPLFQPEMEPGQLEMNLLRGNLVAYSAVVEALYARIVVQFKDQLTE